MNRPTLTPVVAALRVTDARFPWIGPTDEEDDVAAALELVEETHQGVADEPDDRGRWGRCAGCAQWWPCPTWVEAEFLAVQFLGRAADRVVARARKAVQDSEDREESRSEGAA